MVKDNCLVVKYGGDISFVAFDDIYFIEILGRLVTVHSKKGDYVFHSSMKSVESDLPKKDFVRTHQSFIINKKYVLAISKNFAELITRDKVPISREKKVTVKNELLQKA